MEQQAKERLTGGIILVAVLVLLVPELLSGPADPQQQAPAAPDQAPMRSYTVDLNDGSQHGGEPVAASTQSVEPAPALAQVDTAGAPESEPAPALASEPVPAPPRASQPLEVPVPEPVRRPKRGPAHEVAARAVPALPPKPVFHPEPAAAQVRPAAGREWTVQVGVFSSRANAQGLAHKLEQRGFAVKVAETGSNGAVRYRVRVGSAPDRAAALHLLQRLKAAGQRDGALVPPGSGP